MLEITKKINGHGYEEFDIITDDGTFEISFEGNLDLYWRYVYEWPINEVADIKELKITKENYYLYSLFELLYKSIKEKKPYQIYPKSIMPDNDRRIKYHGGYELYKNGEITWYSDDFAEFDNASRFTIKKYKDYYLVTFIKSKTEACNGFFFPTYSVRIRNDGSRYAPFNIAFMGMYQRLKDYDFSYHQIHIEEYLYQKKRVLTK